MIASARKLNTKRLQYNELGLRATDRGNIMYHARYEKPPKTIPYLWPKKVETYSSSNAVILTREEKVS